MIAPRFLCQMLNIPFDTNDPFVIPIAKALYGFKRAGADWGRLEAEQTLVRQHLDSLIELQTCKVCLDRSIAGVIVPCGHLVLCLECASHLKVGSACPICREPATAFSLTFSA